MVDCWGDYWCGHKPEDLTPAAWHRLTTLWISAIIGIFGNDDHSPTAERVNQHEAATETAAKL
ncbi:MAG: hypothetical protein R2932_58715 [Caldilineaceae bacterium]